MSGKNETSRSTFTWIVGDCKPIRADRMFKERENYQFGSAHKVIRIFSFFTIVVNILSLSNKYISYQDDS